jgi:hypothetical protein
MMPCLNAGSEGRNQNTMSSAAGLLFKVAVAGLGIDPDRRQGAWRGRLAILNRAQTRRPMTWRWIASAAPTPEIAINRPRC